MKFSEEELKKRIQESAEEVEIPESLEPENIEKMLETKQQSKRGRWKPAYTVAAAACCVLLVGSAVFGYNYQNKSQTADETATENTTEQGEKSKKAGEEKAEVHTATAVASAKDYDELFQVVETWNQRENTSYMKESAVAEDRMAAGAAESGAKIAAAEYAGDSGSQYSDTNIREFGVQEGDIIKTDGENLYILNGRKLQIVSLQGKQMEEKGSIRLEDNQFPSELYVKDKNLVLVYTQSEYAENGEMYAGAPKQYTVAETYDVSNPDKPKSKGKVTQSGEYYTMRISGDYVYLFSSFYADYNAIKTDRETYIPMVQGKLLESKSIYMPQILRGNRYTVVSAYSLKNPEKKIDSKAIFGDYSQIYVSKENIYVCENDYEGQDSDVTQTCIRKISYKDGVLKAIGQTRIDGILNDTFSLDEYKGNLRLVTTVSGANNSLVMPLWRDAEKAEIKEEPVKDSNSLYILDKNLDELSRIDGIAKDEQVYSARFMGDIGYFVTYKNTDPLFSVDLSNPKQPEIIGELKIPGFSEYLHPFGKGLLLGIGMDTDETGTTTNGVKLSMFDVSNPKDVAEIEKYVLENHYSADVFYNYKCVLADSDKNLIGFSSYGTSQHYYLFTYNKDGFECVLDREITGYSSARGIYVDEVFYLVSGNTVEAYQIGSFEKLDDIVL